MYISIYMYMCYTCIICTHICIVIYIVIYYVYIKQCLYVKLIPFAVHLKLTQHCKSTIFQLKKKKFKIQQILSCVGSPQYAPILYITLLTEGCIDLIHNRDSTFFFNHVDSF